MKRNILPILVFLEGLLLIVLGVGLVAARREISLRASPEEVRALSRDVSTLARSVEALSRRVDSVAAALCQREDDSPPAAAPPSVSPRTPRSTDGTSSRTADREPASSKTSSPEAAARPDAGEAAPRAGAEKGGAGPSDPALAETARARQEVADLRKAGLSEKGTYRMEQPVMRWKFTIDELRRESECGGDIRDQLEHLRNDMRTRIRMLESPSDRSAAEAYVRTMLPEGW